MGVTRFPNGINCGDEAGAAGAFQVGGTAISFPVGHATTAGKLVEAGTIVVPTGASGTAFTPPTLTTINYVLASPYSTVEGVAGYAGVHASQAGGTITLIGISGAGTASTASGTATWLAIGS